MIVYRLTKKKYKDQLSGIGAELHGGRWNNKGVSIIYTCESRALCMTEIAVHTPLGIIPGDYFLQSIELPKTAIIKITKEMLPKAWKHFPHPTSTKRIGDKLILENKHLVIITPSAIVQDEFNFLINPGHKDFNKVKILKSEKVDFDKRLFVKQS